MSGPDRVADRRAPDWQRYVDHSQGEAGRKSQLAAEMAPSAKDYDRIAPSKTNIGLASSGPAGVVQRTPAARTHANEAAQREAAAKHARVIGVVRPERLFVDLRPLTMEIFRLKAELQKPREPEIAQAAKHRLCMLQAQWVGMATTANIPQPAGRLDPLTAEPGEVSRAFMWSEAGGTIPRAEVETDGGKAFLCSVREAVTLHVHGFDALLEIHRRRPETQKALLHRELKRLGDAKPPRDDDTVERLNARRRDMTVGSAAERRREDAEEMQRQLYIGLDGFVGNAERIASYERSQALAAMSSGTATGSILATYAGGGDVEKMRALSDAGSAVEGLAGAAVKTLRHGAIK